MKLAKQNKNLLEQIIIQKKIIEELNYKINLLEEENLEELKYNLDCIVIRCLYK